MAARLTVTRRGLVLVAYSEIPLASVGLVFVLVPKWTFLLPAAVALSLLVGAPAGLALWAGRREFGSGFARNVRWATMVFTALFLALLLAFFQVTSVFPESMRLRDLYGPWFFLGLALVADTVGILLLCWPLLLPGQRRFLHATWAIGALALAAYVLRGRQALERWIDVSGGTAAVPAEAASYARDFMMTIGRDWMLAILALRAGFWPSLYRALVNVAEAERESAMSPSSEA
jgi:hypothetical protein